MKENQAVSMKVLHDIFGLETEDTRYRSKLKSRIQTTFPSKLYFLTVNSNIPEVVLNASAIVSHITLLIIVIVSNKQPGISRKTFLNTYQPNLS